MGAKGATQHNPILCSIHSHPAWNATEQSAVDTWVWWFKHLKVQSCRCFTITDIRDVFPPFNLLHVCFWKTNRAHTSDQLWQQQMPVSSVTFTVLWLLCISPSRCLRAYNSQIMSSSLMYSQWSVCVDLQAALPPSHTQPAPGTKHRLHLVSQTTKSVRGSLLLLLYSVINGGEHPHRLP